MGRDEVIFFGCQFPLPPTVSPIQTNIFVCECVCVHACVCVYIYTDTHADIYTQQGYNTPKRRNKTRIEMNRKRKREESGLS